MLPHNLSLFKHRSVFVKWLVVFNVLIIISILVVGVVSYRTSSSLLIQEARTTNSIYMEQARDNIDKEIIVLESVLQQISLHPGLRRMMYMSETLDLSQTSIYEELVKYLSSVKLSNPIIQNLWIDITKESSIINNEAKYEKQFYYSSVYPFTPRAGWNASRQSEVGIRALGRQVINDIPVIVFARPAPIEGVPYLGAIYASLNEREFTSRINSTKLGASNGIVVIDSKGELILKNEGTVTKDISGLVMEINTQHDKEGAIYKYIDGSKHLIVYSSSKVNDWTYVSLIPIESIMDKVNTIQKTTMYSVVIILVAGLVISYFLTHRIYKPINKIIQYINIMGVGEGTPKEIIHKHDELSFINQLINTVHGNNENLKDTLERQAPLLQQKFLYDLVEGRVHPKDFSETLSAIKLSMPYDSFQLLIFECVDFNLDDRINIGEERVLDIFEEHSSSIPFLKVYFIQKRNDKVVAIMNLNQTEDVLDAVYDYIASIRTYFTAHYSKKFTVGIGKLSQSIEEIPLSYVNALTALRYKIVKGQGAIIFIDEIEETKTSAFSYSMEVEKQLINQLKTADSDQVKETLDDIFNCNIQAQQASPDAIDHLYKALAGTAIRTVNEIESSIETVFGAGLNLYKEIDQCNTLEGKRLCIDQALAAIIQYVQSRTESQYEQLLSKIKEYVEMHYTQDLSLPQLGEMLKMSPTYLSSKFKEITGMKFVDFVNSRRIQQAKLYLRESDDSVNSIAERVGFVNVNTFIKVFKKHEGVTPGQYRLIK